jgi:EAL domain-containing protein (putative c-di-GMP-specific phosphodiesterase class I)
VPVIAEGIERQAQLERLLELGGHLGQGYLLGAPMEPAAISARLGPARADLPAAA